MKALISKTPYKDGKMYGLEKVYHSNIFEHDEEDLSAFLIS